MKLIISEALHVKFNLPALPLISNIYYGGACEVLQRCTCSTIGPPWHRLGTDWALRPRSVNYCWTQCAFKGGVDCLQYTNKII